ncbi:hypothetical protein ACTXT7_003723, partial [Hymenolepis weldensis]
MNEIRGELKYHKKKGKNKETLEEELKIEKQEDERLHGQRKKTESLRAGKRAESKKPYGCKT